MTTWLDSVFSVNNGLDLSRIDGPVNLYPGPLGELLSCMVSNVRRYSSAICLPRLDKNKQIIFYLAADSTEQVSELRTLAHARLGKAYCYIDPIIHSESKDPVELALLSEYPSGFVKLSIPIACNSNKPKVYWVIESLNDLIEQYRSRPVSYSLKQRPVGRILRDVFVALREGNAESGSEYVEELRAMNQLSAQNLLYLEFQLLAVGQRWNYIADHPRITDLVGARLPRKVVGIILRALSMTSLKPDIIQNTAVQALRERIQHISALFYRDIDTGKQPADSPELQAWFIGAMALGNHRSIDYMSDHLDSKWMRSVQEWAGIDARKSSAESVAKPLDRILEEVPSVEIATHLIQLSITADNEQSERILGALKAYPTELIRSLKSNSYIAKIINALEQNHLQSDGIEGWDDFFRFANGEAANDHLLQIAFDNCSDWSVSTWSEGALIESLEENLQKSDLLRNLLPVMLSWLEECDITLSPPTSLQLLLLLVSDDVISVSDMNLCRDLLSGLLRHQHTKVQYQDGLDLVEECWKKVESVTAVPGMLEIMEVLVEFPSANSYRRQQLWEFIQQFIVSFWSRLPKHLQLLSQALAREFLGTDKHLQIPIERAEEEPQETTVDMTGRKLAIYTLTEGAGRRAKQTLQQLFPGLEILLNHDKKASDALLHLTETADYFVFVARSAAHQAFYPVTQKRSDLIYPPGKGSSSIVNSFIEYINREYSL